MKKLAKPTPSLIPSVAYLRRSTNRQEKSLDDQRTEIERYAAANGYHIVRWYQDDGISGDSTECRVGFLALHKAACNGRNFDENSFGIWTGLGDSIRSKAATGFIRYAKRG